jgi:SWI/SNF chromatin-remodeling complex subunit SWI1
MRLDIIKALLTIFANIAHLLVLESSKDAFVLILFVLSFAPSESPYSKDGELFFSEYVPSIHRYLPNAIDILAKILPRDPPNKDVLKSVLLGTCDDPDYLTLLKRNLQDRKPRPYEYLTQVFGLAISTFPHTDFRVVPRGLELRRPLLHQSLLAAEILVEMIPEYKPDQPSDLNPRDSLYGGQLSDLEVHNCNIALHWLEASDGFGAVLLRAACTLGAISVPQVPGRVEENPFARITQRSISILRHLGKKSIDRQRSVEGNTALPPGVLPKIEALLGAMLAMDMDKMVVRQLCAFSEESGDVVVNTLSNNAIAKAATVSQGAD